MQIRVNDQSFDIEENMNVNDLLRINGWHSDSIAIALDGIFLARHKWNDQILQSGQVIEILAPMQGG